MSRFKTSRGLAAICHSMTKTAVGPGWVRPWPGQGALDKNGTSRRVKSTRLLCVACQAQTPAAPMRTAKLARANQRRVGLERGAAKAAVIFASLPVNVGATLAVAPFETCCYYNTRHLSPLEN